MEASWIIAETLSCPIMQTGLPAGKKAKGKKGGGKSVVDLAYLSAKAAKGEARARAAGKLPPKRRESKKKEKAPKRKEEMEELFGSDMSAGKKGSRDREDKKPKRKPGVGKKAFKSKARWSFSLPQCANGFCGSWRTSVSSVRCCCICYFHVSFHLSFQGHVVM